MKVGLKQNENKKIVERKPSVGKENAENENKQTKNKTKGNKLL